MNKLRLEGVVNLVCRAFIPLQPHHKGQEVNPPYRTAARNRALDLEGLGSNHASVLSCCGTFCWKVPLSEPQSPLQ